MEKNSLRDLQEKIAELSKRKGWEKDSPQDKFLFLTEELGEVAKAMRKELNIYNEKNKSTKEELASELADVLSYVLDLSNIFKIDLQNAFLEKLKINEKRFRDKPRVNT